MNKQTIKKIITILIVVLLAFTIVSCDKNGNGNGNDQPKLNLPEEIIQKEKDEIIYVNISEEGQIDSIKATNRIKDSVFAYYEDYGMYIDTGNLNITSGRGPILIKEDKALIPSLQTNNNMFYTLNLNKAYYESLLPFSITPSYKLNNTKVTFDKLKGATGEIKLTFKFKQNKESHQYFLDNYAAQVQIPIDIDRANIISADGAMQQVLVGKTMTLIYMIMPGSEVDVEIVLDANNFYFEGFQAVLQPFEISSMLDFLPIDLANSFDIQSIPDELDELLTLLTFADDSLGQLFNELLPNLSTIKEEVSGFDQLEELVDGLNNPLLMSSLNSLTVDATYKTGFTDKKQIFITLIDQIELSIKNVNNSYNLIDNALDNFLQVEFNVEPLVTEYQDLYSLFGEVIAEFRSIKTNLETITVYDDLNLNVILDNREEFIEAFKAVGKSSDLIKENLQKLILGMYLLPNKLDPLMSVLINVATPVTNLFAELVNLKQYFEDVADNIDLAIENDWLRFTLIPKSLLTMLTKEVEIGEEGPVETPGLIQGLTLALDAADDIEEFAQVTDLYKVDSETSLRQIDMIPYTFIQINEGLTLKQEDQDISFYEGMDLIKQLPTILELLPSSTTDELPSFLSELNLPPTTVQFVYKQRGF